MNKTCSLVNAVTPTYADTVSLPVAYFGESATGQFLFGNGVLHVDTVTNSLPDAVNRFGKRINTGGPSMQYSGAWSQGKRHAQAGKPYAPVAWKLQPVSRTEYGLGYLAGLLEERPALPVVVPVVQRAPVLTPPLEWQEPTEPKPAKKRRGRPKKSK